MPLDLPHIRKKVYSMGKSQTELARVIGISQAHLSRILNGEKGNPDLKTLEGLARAIGCKVQDLLDRTKG